MPAARTGPTASRRRAWGILILAVVAIAAYAAVLYNFDLTETPSESRFGAGTEVAERLMVYLQPVSVDPLNQTMQVKVDLQPGPGLAGNRPGTPAATLQSASCLTIRLCSVNFAPTNRYRNSRLTPTSPRAASWIIRLTVISLIFGSK